MAQKRNERIMITIKHRRKNPGKPGFLDIGRMLVVILTVGSCFSGIAEPQVANLRQRGDAISGINKLN